MGDSRTGVGLGFESTIAQPVVASPSEPRISASIGTPEAALAQDEVDRTRIFLRVSMLMAAIVAVTLPLMSGDPLAKGVFAASAAGVMISGAWLLWVLRAPERRYAEWKKVFVGTFCGACGCAAVYYWGIFSPASIVLVFGVFFMSGQGSIGAGLWTYLQCALFQLGASLAVYGGALADRGVFRPPPIAALDFVVSEVTIQGVLLASFLFARATRTTALSAIGQLERTVRDAGRREALLLEARADLARARAIGGPGRFTDQTLGSYTLGALIGRGGMGEVYEARHVRTGALAAVKMLHRHLLVDGENVARFVREARVVQALRSEHVVQVIEVSDEESPLPFLAMERLVGRDLGEVLRDAPRLDLAAAVDLVDQIARGVAAAHAAGVVHRDLKPQNVFRADRGDGRALWKVLDFGLSKLADQTANLTRGQVVGTPAYMAPEQARGHDVDARADVYALGAIAYRALTGQPPYQGTDLMVVLLDVVQRMPRRPRAVAGDLPEDVERVLLVALAKDPGDRFADVGELAAALASAAAGKLDGRVASRAAALAAKHPWRVAIDAA